MSSYIARILVCVTWCAPPDDEKKWLHSIDALEERWAERLLVNGTDTAKTLSSGNAKGKSEATWHAKFHDTKAAARAAGGDDVG